MEKTVSNIIICKDCGKHFTVAAELNYLQNEIDVNKLYGIKAKVLDDYKNRTVDYNPSRCFDCRSAKITNRKNLKL